MLPPFYYWVQILFHQTRGFCFSWYESPSGAFWYIPGGLSFDFYWEVASVWLLPHWPDWWSATEMVVLLEGFPLSTESSVRVTISFLTMAIPKWNNLEPDNWGSVPWNCPVSEVSRQFLGHHGLVFALTCTVSCGTSYKQVCASPNHIQLADFTTGGSCRNISGTSEAQWTLNFECHNKMWWILMYML